jgi:hypothetical protein
MAAGLVCVHVCVFVCARAPLCPSPLSQACLSAARAYYSLRSTGGDPADSTALSLSLSLFPGYACASCVILSESESLASFVRPHPCSSQSAGLSRARPACPARHAPRGPCAAGGGAVPSALPSHAAGRGWGPGIISPRSPPAMAPWFVVRTQALAPSPQPPPLLAWPITRAHHAFLSRADPASLDLNALNCQAGDQSASAACAARVSTAAAVEQHRNTRMGPSHEGEVQPPSAKDLGG